MSQNCRSHATSRGLQRADAAGSDSREFRLYVPPPAPSHMRARRRALSRGVRSVPAQERARAKELGADGLQRAVRAVRAAARMFWCLCIKYTSHHGSTNRRHGLLG